MKIPDVSRIQIAYGLQDGHLRHISEVPRGLSCNCSCPRCGGALIARQGNDRMAHFAHKHESHCDGGIESVLHRLAKELIGEMRSISIPAYEFSRRESVGFHPVEYSKQLTREGEVSISKVQIEHRLSAIVPDLILWCGERSLIVEIAVTHRVDDLKRAEITATGLPAIEIRLTPADSLLSREELRAKLANDLSSKHWLFHPRQLEHEKKFRSLVEDARNGWDQERRKADRLFRDSLKHAGKSQQSSSKADPFSMNDFLRFEQLLAQFYRQHQRYPSIEESVRLHRKLGR